jgi:hypothetical protein
VRRVDVFKAAQHTEKPALPHQQAAWQIVQEALSPEALEAFGEVFYAGPPVFRLPLQQDSYVVGPNSRDDLTGSSSA